MQKHKKLPCYHLGHYIKSTNCLQAAHYPNVYPNSFRILQTPIHNTDTFTFTGHYYFVPWLFFKYIFHMGLSWIASMLPQNYQVYAVTEPLVVMVGHVTHNYLGKRIILFFSKIKRTNFKSCELGKLVKIAKIDLLVGSKQRNTLMNYFKLGSSINFQFLYLIINS